MWHTVLELCDSGLRDERTRVPALGRELGERVAVRVGLLRRAATDPGGVVDGRRRAGLMTRIGARNGTGPATRGYRIRRVR